jgi:Glutathione S-transferase, N-terminal domain
LLITINPPMRLTPQQPDSKPALVMPQQPDSKPALVMPQQPDSKPALVMPQQPDSKPAHLMPQQPDSKPALVSTPQESEAWLFWKREKNGAGTEREQSWLMLCFIGDVKEASPLNAVPALKDGDTWITESGAITEYILARYGKPRSSTSSFIHVPFLFIDIPVYSHPISVQ